MELNWRHRCATLDRRRVASVVKDSKQRKRKRRDFLAARNDGISLQISSAALI